MNRLLAFPLLAALALVFSGAAFAGPNLIVNGGFEQPPVGGGYQLFSAGQSFPGWQVVGTPGANVAPISGAFTQNGFIFPARSGKQWLDLTGTSDAIGKAGGGVAQTVKTVPGRRYLLTFSVGNVVDPGIFGTSSRVKVLMNGHLLISARNSGGTGDKRQVWKTFSVHFTAKSAQTQLAFLNGDPFKDTSNGLDAISLTRI